MVKVSLRSSAAAAVWIVAAASRPSALCHAWSVNAPTSAAAARASAVGGERLPVPSHQPSRREALAAAAGLLLGAAPAFLPARAARAAEVEEETPRIVTRMGGLLEPFQDGPRSVRIMAPSGWNRFEGEVGAYDLKWQDLVDPSENIKVSSTPVKSSTESIAALGPVQELGASLAAKRNAKLVAASERLTDGVLFYQFEFAINDGTHQLLELCVCRGKLWSLDANAKEKRWAKRDELYRNVLGSFMPKLG